MAGSAERDFEVPSEPAVATTTQRAIPGSRRSWLLAGTIVAVVSAVVLVIVIASSGSPGPAAGKLTLVDRLFLPAGGVLDTFGGTVSPDGSTVYVTTEAGSEGPPGQLDAIDVATDQVRIVARGVGNVALSVAVSPDGHVAYVTDHYGDALTPVDLVSGRIQPRIPLGMEPASVVIAGHGLTAYVASASGHTVVPVNLATRTAGAAITVAGPGRRPEPEGASVRAYMAVSPDGSTVYVTVPDRGVLVPIDTSTNQAGTPVAAGQVPQGVAITPDGKTAYVTNAPSPGEVTAADTVTPIDLRTGRQSQPITIDLNVLGPIVIAPGGRLALIGAAGDVLLTSVDLTTHTVVNQLRIADSALSIALTRAGTRAYIVTRSGEVDVVQLSP